MKLFHLSLSALMLRLYLMMAIVILAGFTGQWLLALLALPVFLTCLMGTTFGRTRSNVETAPKARPITQDSVRGAHAS